MRRILVGVLVAMVAGAGSALAGPCCTMRSGAQPERPCCMMQPDAAQSERPCCMMHSSAGSTAQAEATVHFTNPSARVIHDERHGAGAEFGLALASSALSVLYFPVRFVYGVAGAELGGIGGWTTGGDLRTAKGLWRPTTEGHYFMRPDYLDGTERFRFSGAVPPVREVTVVEEHTTASSDAVEDDRAPVDGDRTDEGDDTL